jgi:DNA-binding transcriptional MerR regulator
MAPPAGPSSGNTEPLSKRPPQQDKTARSAAEEHVWREDLATSLRQQGVPEGEIQAHLDGLNAPSGPPSAEEIYPPYELTPGEMSDDELREKIRSSLQDSGFPPEEIEQHVEAAFQMMRKGQQEPTK